MARAISVIVGTLILLSVGFYLGSRPGEKAIEQLDASRTDFQVKIGEFEARALEAESRRDLWRARSELLAAALLAGDGDYEHAIIGAEWALDLLIRANARPGMHLDLSELQTSMESAVTLLRLGDVEAARVLRRSAEELGILLDRQRA